MSDFKPHPVLAAYLEHVLLSSRQRYDALNLRPVELAVLIAAGPRASNGMIVARLHLSKARVSQYARKLEELGLVIRRINPDDQRTSFIQLSAKGERELDKLALALCRLAPPAALEHTAA